MRIAFASGRVVPVVPDGRVFDAIVVDGDRISAVGAAFDVAAGTDLRVVGLGGRTLLPGFVDAHDHLAFTGAELAQVDVRSPGVSSIHELVGRIAEAAERTPDGSVIRAVGMNDRAYPDGRLPTRWDLDEATRVHPVFVTHISGHHVLANSVALEQRGVSDATGDPPGGHLERDERGRLTGYAFDAAQQLLLPGGVEIGHHGPGFHDDAPLDEVVGDIERACAAYVAAGVTSICDAQVTRRELDGYREARRRGSLSVRVTAMPISSQQEDYAALGIAGRIGDARLAIGPMKFYADGALTGGTAAFTRPYGSDSQYPGSLYWESDKAFREAVVRAHESGWQVGIHAQGDRGIDRALDALDAAQAALPRTDARHRIEHCGGPRPDQVERMARLGVWAIGQPRYFWDAGDDWLRAFDEERAGRLQPYREFAAAGVAFAISTDAPVASYRPVDTLASAALRHTVGGATVGPDQALTIVEAVRAYTLDAARSFFVDDLVGSLEPGKLADLVVLDGDPARTPPDRLPELRVLLTLMGGEPVYDPLGLLGARPGG
ncbi:MAG TPA: amidohydrolase family protein [Candidatus Limnocylindrales bacterium]